MTSDTAPTTNASHRNVVPVAPVRLSVTFHVACATAAPAISATTRRDTYA